MYRVYFQTEPESNLEMSDLHGLISYAMRFDSPAVICDESGEVLRYMNC